MSRYFHAKTDGTHLAKQSATLSFVRFRRDFPLTTTSNERSTNVQNRGVSVRAEEIAVQLELSNSEAKTLKELLTSALSDLSMEISDTDNASFRRELRERRELLEGIDRRLGQAPQQ
jgi:hypothetical protein